MKRALCGILSLILLGCVPAMAEGPAGHKLLYQGHGSLRVVTGEAGNLLRTVVIEDSREV